jgi:hypothetical protein
LEDDVRDVFSAREGADAVKYSALAEGRFVMKRRPVYSDVKHSAYYL